MNILSLLSALLLAGVFLGACGIEEVEENPNSDQVEVSKKEMESSTEKAAEKSSSLELMEHQSVGDFLTDADGRALYYFANDEPGTSNCSGECLENWPPFYAEHLNDVPQNFNKDDFGTITREDTEDKQTTYKGYPLYYFVKDESPGDVHGQGVKDLWYIVNSDTTFK
ncbi:COG4315 family predicted lipoprotein [Alteribacillus bidgolensis]|uniref:Lipoprotein with Yx(FWY)xxD motif n=1 Tax=Alteribacillus bidgolensis TaxID=930129 RepID=A0A1G8H5K0_9BACI|nr:hypothetical protein [Alteribacillus bidgolensis]SDI01906.1 Secreted repeat of unknown function [Alteribacillus bidgolensis]